MNVDLEQFKLILETVKAAGNGAFTLAIVWFAKEVLSLLLAYGIGTLVALLCYKGILKAVNAGSYWGEIKRHIPQRIGLEWLSDEDQVKLVLQLLRKHEKEVTK